MRSFPHCGKSSRGPRRRRADRADRRAFDESPLFYRRRIRGMTAPYDTASRVDAAVWIGGYRAAADPEFARRAGFTHVVKMFADGARGPDNAPTPVVRHPGVQYF